MQARVRSWRPASTKALTAGMSLTIVAGAAALYITLTSQSPDRWRLDTENREQRETTVSTLFVGENNQIPGQLEQQEEEDDASPESDPTSETAVSVEPGPGAATTPPTSLRPRSRSLRRRADTAVLTGPSGDQATPASSTVTDSADVDSVRRSTSDLDRPDVTEQPTTRQLPTISTTTISRPASPLSPLAESARANNVVASDGTNLLFASTNRAVSVPLDGGWGYSYDGEYIWIGDNGGASTRMLDAEGNIVCETDESALEVNRTSDGRYEYIVEGQRDDRSVGPVPAFAVDCQTGARLEAAPRSYFTNDGTTLSFVYRGGRTFEVWGDEEGNVYKLVDASGTVVIPEEDNASLYDFSADASIIVHTADDDRGLSSGAARARTVVVRETSTGQLIWSYPISSGVIYLALTETHVVIGVSDDFNAYWYEGDQTVSRAVVLSARTGELEGSVTVGYELVAVN